MADVIRQPSAPSTLAHTVEDQCNGRGDESPDWPGTAQCAADIANDPHYRARGMIEEHEVSIEPGEHKVVRFPGIIPRLSETPGETQWLGPTLGAHNAKVYGQLLGFTPDRLLQLQQQRVI